mgnify:CR=1 FL=1
MGIEKCANMVRVGQAVPYEDPTLRARQMGVSETAAASGEGQWGGALGGDPQPPLF